jgi:hypothetical protein
MARSKTRGQICSQNRAGWDFAPPAEDLMTISMHKMSVGVFSQFLGSLSGLLDHAAVYAEVRKIDPSILLNARLYPNMYNLTRHVGEAIRHAVVASVQRTAVLFSRHHGLRHLAPLRRRSRQEGLFGNARSSVARLQGLIE